MGSKTDDTYSDFMQEAMHQRSIASIPALASMLTGFAFLISFMLHDTLFSIVCAFTALVYGLAYFMVRKGMLLRLTVWLVILNTLLLFNAIWFRFDGSKGSGLSLLLVQFIVMSILFVKAERILALAILMVNLVVVIFLEMRFPQLIKPYESDFHRLFDIFITFCLCFVFVALVIHYIITSYYREKTRAEMADRLKSSFLQNISHEIRTPMNAIMGFSSILTQDHIQKRERHLYAAYINSACRSLVNTIDEILDIARIESNQYEVQFEECRISELLDHVYRYFLDQPGRRIRKGVEFRLDNGPCSGPGPSPEDLTLKTDPALLKQVLISLVDNAVKFTYSGYIAFGCTKQGNELLFHVRDTGIGIPEKEFGTLFHSFLKAQYPTEKVSRGLGLGLSISRKILSLLGGRIWFESKEGEGSTFYFSFPVHAANPVRSQVSQP